MMTNNNVEVRRFQIPFPKCRLKKQIMLVRFAQSNVSHSLHIKHADS